MVNSEFRKPLIQSAAILGAVFIIFSVIPSAGAAGGGIGALFSGIGSFILFLIGMAIAVPFSIAILIAIFLGAVALMSRETASQMYSDLKKNFSSNIVTLKDQWSCCSTDTSSSVTEEQYNQMKEEIAQLGTKNSAFQHELEKLNINNGSLQNDLEKLSINNSALQEDIEILKNENISLNGNFAEQAEQNGAIQKQFSDLSQVVDKVQNSGKEQTSLISTLSAKVDEGQKSDLEDKLSDLALLQNKSSNTLKDISERLAAMETSDQETSDQETSSGILSYIENDDDQTLFTMAVEEAIAQELTYVKIDEYLTENLSPELDKIIKDHPSLTKTYIRNLKK